MATVLKLIKCFKMNGACILNRACIDISNKKYNRAYNIKNTVSKINWTKLIHISFFSKLQKLYNLLELKRM